MWGYTATPIQRQPILDTTYFLTVLANTVVVTMVTILNDKQNSGVRLYFYSHYNTPDIWGIFTCQIPDSEGNNVETSIGIYSSKPCKLTRKISL